jgi:hypothetical protein
MTGAEFKANREEMGCTVGLLGLLLGYRGNLDTITKTVRGYEARGADDVPEHIGRLVYMLKTFGAPEDWWSAAEADLIRLNSERGNSPKRAARARQHREGHQ